MMKCPQKSDKMSATEIVATAAKSAVPSATPLTGKGFNRGGVWVSLQSRMSVVIGINSVCKHGRQVARSVASHPLKQCIPTPFAEAPCTSDP